VPSKTTFVPAFWCDPTVATSWLEATGWTIEGHLAVKPFRAPIPAPRAGVVYDLHDVSFEERLSAPAIVDLILEWSGRPDVSGDTHRVAPPSFTER
jgi:hypothetical protein